MNRIMAGVAASVVALTLAGCAAESKSAAAPAQSGATAKGVPAPADSPLAKVTLGMTKKQVKDVLGPPTDENSYSTGKAWIPFYFGTDARRTSFYYKGIGRVVFADGNVFGGGAPEVVRVDYDPTESGTAR